VVSGRSMKKCPAVFLPLAGSAAVCAKAHTRGNLAVSAKRTVGGLKSEKAGLGS
jgi:hypothetical protein